MSQQLQAAIKLLQLTNLEVEAAIAEELAKNPLLEMGSDGDVVVREDVEFGEAAADPKGADELGGKGDEALDSDWREAAGETDASYEIGGERRGRVRLRPAGELRDGLVRASDGAAAWRRAGAREAIVHELEETGWLTTPLKAIAEALEVPVKEVEAALRHRAGPRSAGVGARNLAECLALQAKAADRYDPAMARLIANLDLLSRGQTAALKRICGVDDEDLADMIRELRAYDPKPGCRFAAEPQTAAEPDVLVHRTRTGFVVELNPATLPRVLVNRRYHQELKTAAKNDSKSRAWLSEQYQSASWLVRALDQRARTIVKITSAIVTAQEGFFRDGVAALRPLTMGKIAEAVEMHESTVSRVAAAKSLLCDHGLFELRCFFASGVAADDGEGASADAVKAAIQRLVAAETEVLSDDQLVDALKEQGMVLARRTVAKYREAVGHRLERPAAAAAGDPGQGGLKAR